MSLFENPGDAPDKLTQLLLTAVPKNEHGNKTLSHMAFLMGVSRWAMRKWITNKKIAPGRVLKIVEIGQGRVKKSQFDEFVYKE